MTELIQTKAYRATTTQAEFVLKLSCVYGYEFRAPLERVTFKADQPRVARVELRDDFIFPSSVLRLFNTGNNRPSINADHVRAQNMARVVRHAMHLIVNYQDIHFHLVPIQCMFAAYVLADFMSLACTEMLRINVTSRRLKSPDDAKLIAYFEQEHAIIKAAFAEAKLAAVTSSPPVFPHVAEYWTSHGEYLPFNHPDTKALISKGHELLRSYEITLRSSEANEVDPPRMSDQDLEEEEEA